MAGDTEEKKPTIDLTMQETEVYETEDLPEEDQHFSRELSFLNSEVEGIELGRLDVKEAFKIFENKNISSDVADFSDSIAGRRSGYKTSQRRAKETKEEKHKRLKKTLDEIKQEISLIKDQSDEEVKGMMAKVDHMMKSLNEKEEHLHPDAKHLLNDLNLFLNTPVTSEKDKSVADVTRYDIVCRDDARRDALKLEALEQRVARCEKIVGKLDSQAIKSPENTNGTVLGALSLIVARFNLLDLTQLSSFDSRLLCTNQKLIHASSKSDASDIADKVDQLEGVYERVKKWDSLSNALPYMVDRMGVMKQWHLQASQFSSTLTELSKAQKHLEEGLQDQHSCLKQIQALLAPQMKLFEDNYQHIEALIN